MKERSCAVSEYCGGCQMLEESYEKQLAWKQKRVQDLLKSFGTCEPILGMKDPFHYRNKIQVSFAQDEEGKIYCGNYLPKSHFVVPVDDCLLADRGASDIIKTVTQLAASLRIPVFDERGMRGCLRHLVIRNNEENEYMVVLVTGSENVPHKEELLSALLKKEQAVVSVVQSVHKGKGSQMMGDRFVSWYRRKPLTDKLLGLDFTISPDSFYQVNKKQTEVLYQTALRMAEPKKTDVLVDAYCGIGTIGMSFASEVKEVIAVEINKQAINDAVYNAKRNRLDNISFVCADAGSFLKKRAAEKKKTDIVVLDPPRSGASQAFLDALLKLSPDKIIYISCNPVTLKRDLETLCAKDYEVTKIQPVDMFPQTRHVECVALLKRIEQKVKR